MSNFGLNFSHDDHEAHGVSDGPDDGPDDGAGTRAGAEQAPPQEPPRRTQRRRRRGRGCLPVLVVLVLLAAGVWFGGNWAVDQVKERFASAPDYPGPGTGQVTVEVKSGATTSAIGRELKSAGVVRSVEAFTDAARKDPKALSIQVGFYDLKKHMKASDALAVLVDPANLVQAAVTIPEGARVKDVVAAIAKHTDFSRAQVEAALAKKAKLGLPPEAEGNPEGYLYPATYSVPPDMTPLELLQQMVDKTRKVEKELDIRARAQALGYSVEQVMTMASLLEYEGLRDQDLPKIARVFYNRIEKGMALQSDATVAYANHLQGTVWTTQAQRDNPSPYNTYVHTGLPPGPIGSPGQRTIEAALKPATGDWLFFVPINLKTGETAFASTYAEHQRNVAKLKDWCARTHSENCN